VSEFNSNYSLKPLKGIYHEIETGLKAPDFVGMIRSRKVVSVKTSGKRIYVAGFFFPLFSVLSRHAHFTLPLYRGERLILVVSHIVTIYSSRNWPCCGSSVGPIIYHPRKVQTDQSLNSHFPFPPPE